MSNLAKKSDGDLSRPICELSRNTVSGSVDNVILTKDKDWNSRYRNVYVDKRRIFNIYLIGESSGTLLEKFTDFFKNILR